MNLFKKFRLAKSPVFELNKNRQYLIAIDNRYFTEDSAVTLSRELKRMGISNLVAMVDGDPYQAIKIIKSKAKPSAPKESECKKIFPPAPVEADKDKELRSQLWSIKKLDDLEDYELVAELIKLINSRVDKAVGAELEKIADTDWTEEDLETNLHNRIAQLTSPKSNVGGDTE